MKKVLFVLLSLLIMAVAVSCDSSATVSADAVLDFSNVEPKVGDKVVIDVTCGSKTMPRQEFVIDDPSQKAPKYKINAVRKSSGTIKVRVYRQNGLLTKSDTEESLVAAGSTEVEDFYEQGTYTVTVYEVYSITYDANGATSGTAPAAQTELIPGDDVVLADNSGKLEKTDKVFKGWNTKADGSGSKYAAGSTVSGGFKESTTLYVEWGDKPKPEDYVMLGDDKFQNKLNQLSGYSESNITSIEFYKTENVPSGYVLGTNVVNLGDYSDGDSRQGNIRGYLIGTDKLVIVGDLICGNQDCSSLFYGLSNAAQIEISDFDTSNVRDMEYMFGCCSGLTSLNLRNFNTSNVTTMYCMFKKCSGLTSLDLSNFDTSNVTNMYYMFSDCSGLTSLNLSNFDTSNVEGMYEMFYNCLALTSLDISSFDTSNVTDMGFMFANCSGLTSLNLSGFNTSKVEYMNSMFNYCQGLTSLDLGNFDTSKVKQMCEMFMYCSGLTSLDLSNFDTSNVSNMNQMFCGCSALTFLDLTSFNPSKAVDRNVSMFWKCGNSGTIVTVNPTYRSFYDTTELGTSSWSYTAPSGTVTAGTYKNVLYNITYVANGATGGTVPATQTELVPGDDVKLADNSGNLEKADKLFNGWNTKDDGTGTHYNAGSTVTGGFGSDTVLYAEWRSSYSITYVANGATSGTVPDSPTFTLGDDVIIANNTGRMEKSGVVFVGWNTKADGSGNRYDAESTVTGGFSGDTTLYAEWIKGEYKWFGGTIFYVHDDNGAKYTFYDTNLKIIPKQDVSSLYYGGATYYIMEGTPSADRFYLYNNDIYCGVSSIGDGKRWSGLGASNEQPQSKEHQTDDVYKYGIGWGKKLTDIYCPVGAQYSGTIWEWLDDGVNRQKLAGYSDWYFPCAAELDKLKASGMKQDWFTSDKLIWTSVEYSDKSAWFLRGDSGAYDYDSKSATYKHHTIAIRSF